MKQLLMSIQPQHLYNILTGKKTLEIRKQIPKGFKGWVNLYCTMVKPYLIKRSQPYDDYMLIQDKSFDNLNGKVVARFWFDEYETFNPELGNPRIYVNACVGDFELYEYANGKNLYAWHIKSLEIFDKPMELQELNILGKGRLEGEYISLHHAPQSYQYVWVKEN